MTTRSQVTCHILDTQYGRPAADVHVQLHQLAQTSTTLSEYTSLGIGKTDEDGRCSNILPAGTTLEAGVYKMIFHTGPYFASTNRETFFPVVEITFNLKSPEQHYHIPLLLSPFSFTTYRGS